MMGSVVIKNDDRMSKVMRSRHRLKELDDHLAIGAVGHPIEELGVAHGSEDRGFDTLLLAEPDAKLCSRLPLTTGPLPERSRCLIKIENRFSSFHPLQQVADEEHSFIAENLRTHSRL